MTNIPYNLSSKSENILYKGKGRLNHKVNMFLKSVKRKNKNTNFYKFALTEKLIRNLKKDSTCQFENLICWI